MASIPDPILDKLRCCKCNNFLSCKPIWILGDGQSLCGRCHDTRPMIIAHAYECVADYFLFPCKNWNKHCAYLLNIKDVAAHEDDCAFGNTCSILCRKPRYIFKSESKLDLTQNIKYYSAPEAEILSTLTCTLCGYYLSTSPIHVNSDSLSICHRCHKSKAGKIPINYVRHYALESILQILIFPCVYRKRGCTKVFKFGSDATDHELTCSYSRTQKTLKTFKDPNNGKQKGVIETHTGHMFGTITPNSQFFVAQNKITNDNYSRAEPLKIVPNQQQERFFNELIKHRESLQYQWYRNSRLDAPISPSKVSAEFRVQVPEELTSEASTSRPSTREFRNEIVERRNSGLRNDNLNFERPISFKSEASPASIKEINGDDRFSFRKNSFQDNYDGSQLENTFRTGGRSPTRPLPSVSSGSDTANSRESTISDLPFGKRSPLKLNPGDLTYSNSFNYLGKQDRGPLPTRSDSFANANALQY